MSRGIPFLLLTCAGLLSVDAAEDFDGFNEAVGVNLTVDEGFGARHSGMGVSFSSFQLGADAVANSPAAMNDVDDFTFSTSHSEKFGRAQFDDFAFIIPFEAHSTLGLGISRFGVSEVDYWTEDSNPLESEPPEVFSVADYMLVGAFARRWGGLDLGFHLDVLYRHLDQDGLGMRADGMAQYTWEGRYRVSTLVKGLIPSTARWQSDYSEYEVPDMHLGGAARFPTPYFYGTLEVAGQTEGLFQKRAKSESGTNASRIYSSPFDLLKASNLGAEFRFDFGLAMRAGLQEIVPRSLASAVTFGFGYTWRSVLGIDYSFTPHPDLLATHRVALQLTPAFPKLNGRGFRPRGIHSPATVPVLPDPMPSDEEGEFEEQAPTPPDPAIPEAPPPIKSSSPAPVQPSQAAPTAVVPTDPAQAEVETSPGPASKARETLPTTQPPITGPAPVQNKQEKEVLEVEEESE